MSLVKTVHPDFVASCGYLGTIGDDSQSLHIYEMDHLPGTPQAMARIPPDDMSRQRTTIRDIARFTPRILSAEHISIIADATEQVLCTVMEQRSTITCA